MSDRNQLPAGASGLKVGSQEKEAQRHLSKDPKAAAMMQANAKLGNDEVQRRIHAGNATRDQLLTFLVQRLNSVRTAQLREISAAQPAEVRRWWMRASDSHKPEYTKPEPTRWHTTARLYEEAAHALCRGDVKRGGALVEQAMAEEQRAFRGVSIVVKTDDLQQGEDPTGALQIAQAQTAGECDAPAGLGVAHDILCENLVIEDMPVRRRPRDPWWTGDEEEDTKKPEDGGQ